MPAIGPRLQLAQRQALTMTPQLQQAIRLLQMSQLELAGFLREELDRNPLLTEGDEEGGAPAGPVEPDRPRSEATEDAAAVLDRPGEAIGEFDERWSGEFRDPGGEAPGATRSTTTFEGFASDGSERLAERPPSLLHHLEAQIAVDIAGAGDRLVAMSLLEMLDEHGYLRGALEEIAGRLGVALGEVERVLARLQQFDPPGVFARSLPECLALQLRERNRLDPAMQALLDNLDLLAQRDLAGLRRRCGVDDEDLGDMLAEIRSLDPRPGDRFEPVSAIPIVPDIFLLPAREPDTGAPTWRLELNVDALPRVIADRAYHATLLAGARDRATRDFLAERLQSANWLVKAVDQRAQTVLRVAAEIVRQQDGFFRRGVAGLRPLILRDIAQAVDLHESTVSRVTANKYIATPRGIYELKYFFTSAIAAAAGADSLSSEAVRQRIRDLIESETSRSPHSDDRLVELLRAQGVDIARRTVAKYREAMRIPSSVERRRRGTMALLGEPLSASPPQPLSRPA